MRWTERQRGMLAEIGVRLFAPRRASAPTAAATAAEHHALRDGTAVETESPPPMAAEPRRDYRPSSDAAPAGAVPRARSDAPLATAPARSVAAPRDSNPAAPAADARRARIAALDWPALAQAVDECRACALCDSRRRTVFGVGNRQARWMIVGEAPGEQEDLKGEPFVGPAGQLMDRMLAALGLTRAEPDAGSDAARQVYIANTLKCRPPRNRNPAPDEMALCEPFLQRQIALIQPTLLLAMGRFAVQMLLRSEEPVGRLRGRVHRYEGVPLVVTYHPAYLLRNPADKARAWDDLCLAAEVARHADDPASH